MKVLSVQNPWAYAIMHLGKDVENRTWRTDFTGEVAIHVSKKEDKESLLDLDDFSGYAESTPTLGMIVGVVTITGYERADKCQSKWSCGDPDAYCWKLSNPLMLANAIPLKGQLGLRDLPEDINRQVLKELGRFDAHQCAVTKEQLDDIFHALGLSHVGRDLKKLGFRNHYTTGSDNSHILPLVEMGLMEEVGERYYRVTRSGMEFIGMPEKRIAEVLSS